MKIIFCLFVSCSLLFISCSKKTTVVGKVINPVTGMGIEGATVVLQQAGKGFPAGLEDIESIISDANGDFNISAKKVKPLTCAVALDSYKYYHLGWSQNNNSNLTLALKKGETTNANYYAVPYGNLKIGVHNVNCQGSTDTLIYERTYLTDLSNPVFYPFTLTGCYDNQGTLAKVPSGYYTIKWTVIRSGVVNVFSQEILVPETGNFEMEINY